MHPKKHIKPERRCPDEPSQLPCFSEATLSVMRDDQSQNPIGCFPLTHAGAFDVQFQYWGQLGPSFGCLFSELVPFLAWFKGSPYTCRGLPLATRRKVRKFKFSA